MFRYLILPTLAALVLVPDWASAFFRRRSAPCEAAPVVPVQYYGPVYHPAPPCPAMFQPPVYAAPATPATPSAPPAAPQVTPERTTTPPKAAAPNTAPKTGGASPLPPPNIPGGTSALPPPRPVESMPPVSPVGGVEERLPPPGVPAIPPAIPGPASSPPPVKEVTPAAPLPAMPKGMFEPTSAKEEPKAPAAKTDPSALPKMELPDPNTPPLPPPLAQPRAVEAKASPLRDLAKAAYELFPAAGPAPASPDAKRTVTFHNFTGKDMLLTVDGTTTTLPAKHSVTGQTAAKFTMQVGAGDAVEVTMPTAAPGADVVLKK